MALVGGESKYQGHGFNEGLPKGKASGEITVTQGVVRFQCTGGDVSFSLEGTEFSLGGASDRLVFIKHGSQPNWSFYTSDRTILQNQYLANNASVAAQIKKAKRTRWFNHSLMLSVVAMVILLPLGFVMSMDVWTALAAEQVPEEWEHSLGETVYAQYQLGERFMEKEQVDEMLMPVAKPLLSALEDPRFEATLAIVDDPAINAFALPGGFVVINSGLILAADSAEEVLGVLSHELAHVTEQHSIRNIISAASVYLTIDLIVGDMTGLLAMVADAAPLLLHQQFSRDFEREADSKGYELLVKANIDPRGLASFFEKLIAEREEQLAKVEDDTARDILMATEGLLSTHPATEERIAYILALAEGNDGPHINVDDNFNALKDAVKLFVVSNNKGSEDATDEN